jgi:hypothetical protein
MAVITWDQVGERLYETGVDRGVLYLQNSQGAYDKGYAWNGLTTVTESPTGAEATPLYADNIKYLNLISAEEFGGTIEAYTYPDEFAACDGTAEPTPGVTIGQQPRATFGLSYRSKLGNDVEGDEYGYKLHLIYGAKAAPTEKAYATVNDSPEAITFSWEISTTPVSVVGHKPTSVVTIDSTKVDPTKLANLEQQLYGSVGVDPSLPPPEAVFAIFGTPTLVPVVTAPTMDGPTKVITIPATVGIVYTILGEVVAAGPLPPITVDTVVEAHPAVGYTFPAVTDDDWFFSAT